LFKILSIWRFIIPTIIRIAAIRNINGTSIFLLYIFTTILTAVFFDSVWRVYNCHIEVIIWEGREKKKTGRAGRVACSACFAVCRCSLFSAAAGSSSVGDAGGDLLHSSTFHGMPPGCFSRGSGAVLFAVPEGGYTLHLTGLRSRCRALT